MRNRLAVLSIVFILFLFCAVHDVSAQPSKETVNRPSIPLPDPAPEEIAVPNWDPDRPLSNSVRAWHYNPDLVLPLLEVGDAIDNSAIDFKTGRMLAAVVASRNHCLY